jgi:hypothetical protein
MTDRCRRPTLKGGRVTRSSPGLRYFPAPDQGRRGVLNLSTTLGATSQPKILWGPSPAQPPLSLCAWAGRDCWRVVVYPAVVCWPVPCCPPEGLACSLGSPAGQRAMESPTPPINQKSGKDPGQKSLQKSCTHRHIRSRPVRAAGSCRPRAAGEYRRPRCCDSGRCKRAVPPRGALVLRGMVAMCHSGRA